MLWLTELVSSVQETSATKKGSFEKMLVDGRAFESCVWLTSRICFFTSSNLLMHAKSDSSCMWLLVTCVGAHAQNNAVNASVQTSVPGKPVVPVPTTNLNIGMDLWNSSSAGAVKMRPSPGVSPAVAVGHEALMPDHQWIQVWFQFKYSSYSIFLFSLRSFLSILQMLLGSAQCTSFIFP